MRFLINIFIPTCFIHLYKLCLKLLFTIGTLTFSKLINNYLSICNDKNNLFCPRWVYKAPAIAIYWWLFHEKLCTYTLVLLFKKKNTYLNAIQLITFYEMDKIDIHEESINQLRIRTVNNSNSRISSLNEYSFRKIFDYPMWIRHIIIYLL